MRPLHLALTPSQDRHIFDMADCKYKRSHGRSQQNLKERLSLLTEKNAATRNIDRKSPSQGWAVGERPRSSNALRCRSNSRAPYTSPKSSLPRTAALAPSHWKIGYYCSCADVRACLVSGMSVTLHRAIFSLYRARSSRDA